MYSISQLFIYPIKGLGGISVQSARALEAGFEHDRRYMIINDENVFISQRQLPEMALFLTKIDDQQLILTYNDHQISFDFGDTYGESFAASIWNDTAHVIEVRRELNDWFSECMQMKVKLVKMVNENSRIHYSSKIDRNIHVNLADGYPYLLVGTSSVSEIDERMNIPIKMSRFRPNIVVDTQTPHEEDQWQEIHFNETIFSGVKPCGRCNVVTINQETSEINKDVLKTLSEYRKTGNAVNFGSNLICTQQGIVKVGEMIVF